MASANGTMRSMTDRRRPSSASVVIASRSARLGRTDTARSAVDADGIAWLDLRDGMQGLVTGQRHEGERRGLFEREPSGHASELVDPRRDVLRDGAAPARPFLDHAEYVHARGEA